MKPYFFNLRVCRFADRIYRFCCHGLQHGWPACTNLEAGLRCGDGLLQAKLANRELLLILEDLYWAIDVG